LDVHSFPTRRSSDLSRRASEQAELVLHRDHADDDAGHGAGNHAVTASEHHTGVADGYVPVGHPAERHRHRAARSGSPSVDSVAHRRPATWARRPPGTCRTRPPRGDRQAAAGRRDPCQRAPGSPGFPEREEWRHHRAGASRRRQAAVPAVPRECLRAIFPPSGPDPRERTRTARHEVIWPLLLDRWRPTP